MVIPRFNKNYSLCQAFKNCVKHLRIVTRISSRSQELKLALRQRPLLQKIMTMKTLPLICDVYPCVAVDIVLLSEYPRPGGPGASCPILTGRTPANLAITYINKWGGGSHTAAYF